MANFASSAADGARMMAMRSQTGAVPALDSAASAIYHTGTVVI
ncbi:MAG: hypothetical protein AB7H71_06360 [Alphaproteobacteria bacterium]